MIKERRKHPRLRIPLEAEYLVAGREEWREGTIWTLGAGGAALLCEEELAQGTHLDGLHFVVAAEGDLPETRIEVGAEVVSIEPDGSFGSSSSFMLGLRFRDLGDQEFELLRQFVFLRLTSSRPSPAGDGDEAPEKVVAPPIEIRFKLFDEFVEEVSENLSPSGMFIRAKRPLPPGSRFVFQFQLGDDFSLFQGTAEVVWTRRRSSDPERPPGMGVRFVKLDLTSQKMVRRLVGQHGAETAPRAAKAIDESRPAVEPEPAEAAGTDDESRPAAALEPEEPIALGRSAPGLAEPDLPEPGRSEPGLPEPQPVALVSASVLSVAAAEPAPAADEGEDRVAGNGERSTELEARLRRAEAERARAVERLEQRDRELERRTEEWERLEAELGQELAQRVAGEAEFQERAERAAEAEAELKQRLEQAEDGRRELERRLERLGETEDEIKRLRLESADAAEEWDAARAELNARLLEKSAGEEELRQRLDRAADHKADFEQRLERVTTQKAELEERLDEAGGLASELSRVRLETGQAAEAWRVTETELRARLEERAAAAEELELRLAESADTEAELRRQLSEAAAARDESEQRLARGAEVEAALREQAKELREGRAELASRLERAQGRLETMRRATAEMKSSLNGDLSAAQALETALAGRLAEVAAVGSSLEQKVEGLSAARADLGRRLARITGAWSTLEDGLAELEQEDLDRAGPEAALEPAETVATPAAASAAEGVVDLSQLGPEARTGEPDTVRAEPAAEQEPEMRQVEPDAAPAEAKGAGGLVGAARRAAALLGFARQPPEGGNGGPSEVAPEPAPEPELEDELAAEPDLEPGRAPGPEAAEQSPESLDAPPPAEADPVAIEETVKAWAAAWSEQRVEDYLSFYSREFAAASADDGVESGEASHAWLPPLAGMELTLGPISQTELAPGRLAVSFEQSVASDSYARRTGRTLEMVREADAWKIASESFQEL